MDKTIKSEIRKLRDNSNVAYVGSINESGFPQIKGMLVLEHEDLKIHYFSTNTSSKRVTRVRFLQVPLKFAPTMKQKRCYGVRAVKYITRKVLTMMIIAYTSLLPKT